MITTGIIIVAASVICMILAFILTAGSAVAEKTIGAIIGVVLYVLCMIGYVVGLAVTAIGIVQALT